MSDSSDSTGHDGQGSQGQGAYDVIGAQVTNAGELVGDQVGEAQQQVDDQVEDTQEEVSESGFQFGANFSLRVGDASFVYREEDDKFEVVLGGTTLLVVDAQVITGFIERLTGLTLDFEEVISQFGQGVAYDGVDPRPEAKGNSRQVQGDDLSLGNFDDAVSLRKKYYEDFYLAWGDQAMRLRHAFEVTGETAARVRDKYEESEEESDRVLKQTEDMVYDLPSFKNRD
ncbi:hypothetical protein [Salininema proteolyticum]|uniref:Uncharacterized protein n=1 Tax=Salininema proteolyticum TaxID=1607685 RepID=A0ABV8TWW2_9ACTN